MVTGNDFDGGYIGIGGNISYGLVTGNEFYGQSGAAISSAAAQQATISANSMNLGTGFAFSTTYVPRSRYRLECYRSDNNGQQLLQRDLPG